MKILISGLAVFVLCSSVSSPRQEPLTDYVPVMMHRSQLESSVLTQPVQLLKDPGKIYIHSNYLFVNEKGKGVHVFNNQNPANPVALGFIRIPGCIDMAIRDGILYADNAVDLVAVNITDPANAREVGRERNVFPEPTPPDNKVMPIAYHKDRRPDGLILISWEKRK